MTARERLAMWECLPRLEAEEELRIRRQNGKLTAHAYRELVLRATGSEHEAQRAFSAFRVMELRAGITPE